MFLLCLTCSYPVLYKYYILEMPIKCDLQSTILFLTTAKLLISCLPVVTCSLKPSSATCWGAIHLFTQVVSVCFLFRSCTVPGFTQIKCTFRCRFSTGGWVIEEEMRCLLMRALKLMCPFGCSEGDLKKSETLSERHSHCLTADQSQSSTQFSATLFRLWSSQIPSAHVLKFLLCAGRLRECHTAVQSDSVRFVEYWVNVLCITTLCQIVRQAWWKKKAIREDVWSSRWSQNSNVAGPDYDWQATSIWHRLRRGE